MPCSPGELRRESVRRAFLFGDITELVVKLAVVDVEKRPIAQADEDGRVAVEFGIVEEKAGIASGEFQPLAVLAENKIFRGNLGQTLAQYRTTEMGDQERESVRRKRLQKCGVEMVLVLVADVDEALAVAVGKPLLHQPGEMMIAWVLKPRRIEGAAG